MPIWIPIATDLPRRREIILIARSAAVTRHEALGLLVDFWGWAVSESRDGHVRSVTLSDLPDTIGATIDFWRAVQAVGWLQETPDGITIPSWQHWLAPSAKVRLQANLRQQTRRRELRQAPKNVTSSSRPDRDESVTRGRGRGRDDDAPATDGSAPPEQNPKQDQNPDFTQTVAVHWSMSLSKARSAIERLGTTEADFVDWTRYQKEAGTRLAVQNFQRFRNPREIPGAKAQPQPLADDPDLAKFLENA